MNSTSLSTSNKIITSIGSIPNAFIYLVRRPRHWKFLITPIILNIILSAVLFIFLTNSINNHVNSLSELRYFETFSVIIKSFSYLLSLILVAWLGLSVAMIITAPFSGMLTERILDEEGLKPIVDLKGISLIVFEINRAIKFEFAKLSLSITIFLITFFINLVPVIGNLLFVVINYYFNAFIHSLDLTDSVTSRLGLGVRAKIANFHADILIFLPFGLVSAFILSIPIINFIFLPILSIAGSQLVSESTTTTDNS